MLRLEIPGTEVLEIEHLILDYNGTIAAAGILITGVAERLEKLSLSLEIHVLTADTYGSVHAQCSGMGVSVCVIGKEEQDKAKLAFLESLDARRCIAVGNGRNDALMLSQAALGFAVMQEEGLSMKAASESDVVFKTINDALDALIHPNRLVATLRN